MIVNADGDTEAAVIAARDVYTLIEPLFTQAGMDIWMEESGIGPPSALKRFLSIHKIVPSFIKLYYVGRNLRKKFKYCQTCANGHLTGI